MMMFNFFAVVINASLDHYGKAGFSFVFLVWTSMGTVYYHYKLKREKKDEEYEANIS
jgi:hypothetical protein